MVDTQNATELDALAERVAGRVFEKLAPYLRGTVSSDEDALLNEVQAAQLLGLQPSTLAAWRSRGGGPEFIRVGSGKKPAIRYQRSAVMQWAQSRRHANTSHCLGAEG